MPRSQGFRDLTVWHKATDLVVDVYRATQAFPGDERFGLTSQMRRAAISVVANVAEGAGRATTGEFANCLSIARGSLNELEALMEISLRLDFLSRASTTRLLPAIEEVSRMLTGLRRSIQRKR